MPRLFTGLEIPPEIGLALAACRGGLPGARWVDPENYHITLRFIGDIDERTAQDVLSVLGEGRRREPLPVTIDGLDTFGGGRPRVVFARASASRDMSELQAEHERLMRRIGLPPDTRRFTPHVTLARLRDASPLDVADYFAARAPFPKLTFTAARFVLFSSRGSVGGGPYVVEAAYPLG
ncbi:RNA 2',3'-cyclic phosphodiesterase [Microvirga thermotolerans]|uniref:RNA 2',3'-cyclic phosphodiesterase n=1 Tax=Microvirga thermotolerans TaxID=2651334 RepID=A0A5P9JYS9_9HYPH|nr:RNA 2',3'-cyclic phosphodiesterase [Microvirga thermotolerans]QFU15084.1 RNA 2',3'-cyclic phosphodiesterase [Microvirga thermotolerans]